MVNQVTALPQAINLPCKLKTLHLPTLWSKLPGHWAASIGILSAVPADDAIHPPWPDLLISCGRRSAGVAIAIRRANQGHTFTVHIQNPRTPLTYFDMIIPPEHDGLSGANVYPTKGALHKLTRETLDQAAEEFRETFAPVRRPMVAVLIGGKSRSYNLTPACIRKLALQLKLLITEQGAGLLITTSRRTGDENTRILRQELTGTDAIIWDGKGNNPYLGMLALADFIMVTQDSVSMVSEACFTGKPVLIVPLNGDLRRFRRFHTSMRQMGLTRPFRGILESWNYQPFDEKQRIAEVLLERFAAHQSTLLKSGDVQGS